MRLAAINAASALLEACLCERDGAKPFRILGEVANAKLEPGLLGWNRAIENLHRTTGV
jgi:hypothetical protein